MKKATATKQLSDSDQQTFHQLYQKYHCVVYSICLRMTQNVSEAEDLTQDVFVQLFRTIGSFRGESAFTSGKPLDEERLKAMPTARYDVECQAAIEKAQRTDTQPTL